MRLLTLMMTAALVSSCVKIGNASQVSSSEKITGRPKSIYAAFCQGPVKIEIEPTLVTNQRDTNAVKYPRITCDDSEQEILASSAPMALEAVLEVVDKNGPDLKVEDYGEPFYIGHYQLNGGPTATPFITGNLLLRAKWSTKTMLAKLGKSYKITSMTDDDGGVSIKLDLTLVSLIDIADLLKSAKLTMNENISQATFSSVNAAKTFKVLAEIQREHMDVVEIVQLNHLEQ